jgi:hypothetical protein
MSERGGHEIFISEEEKDEGISHKDQTIKCPCCGCELMILKKIVVDKLKDILRESVKK